MAERQHRVVRRLPAHTTLPERFRQGHSRRSQLLEGCPSRSRRWSPTLGRRSSVAESRPARSTRRTAGRARVTVRAGSVTLSELEADARILTSQHVDSADVDGFNAEQLREP